MRESTIFYSFRLQEELLNINNSFVWGKSHYSYKVIKNRYISLLKHQQIKVCEIIRPEIYKHKIALDFLKDFKVRDIHLIFKPFEEIRILKGAYNIGIIAWEFDRINTTTLNRVPFSNHFRVLSMLNEIWVLCEYTKKVLQQHNIQNVYCIPAPVTYTGSNKKSSVDNLIGGFPAVKLDTINLAPQKVFLTLYNDLKYVKKIYLTVVNPWDTRKNLEEIITSFVNFSNNYKQALLIIKLVIDNQGTTLFNINEILAKKIQLKSPNIIFISQNLTDTQMSALMQSVDYYYCISKAEGQNLPLIEAMSAGTVPVSTTHTAMTDYIHEDNSFTIKSSLESATINSNASRSSSLYWYKPEINSAIKALETSYKASSSEYKLKSDNCIKTVESLYSDCAVFARIIQRINFIIND